MTLNPQEKELLLKALNYQLTDVTFLDSLKGNKNSYRNEKRALIKLVDKINLMNITPDDFGRLNDYLIFDMSYYQMKKSLIASIPNVQNKKRKAFLQKLLKQLNELTLTTTR